jgi:DNA-binding response OmpR family regulator
MSSRRTTILIVEDDLALRHMYRAALAFAGFDTREVGDGLDALRHIDADPPDAVLLDLGLPLIDGFTVQQDIAAHAVTRHIPIIVVTGSGDDLDWLDVACVLRKPVTPDKLVDAVRKCLESGGESAGR